MLLGLVVSSKSVDSGLDKNESELGVLVLSIAVQMSSDINSTLDQVIEIFRDLRSQSRLLEDSQDLLSRNGLDLRVSLGVSKDDTNLRGSLAFLRQLSNLSLHSLSIFLDPRRLGSRVRESRAGDTLSIAVHTTHGAITKRL